MARVIRTAIRVGIRPKHKKRIHRHVPYKTKPDIWIRLYQFIMQYILAVIYSLPTIFTHILFLLNPFRNPLKYNAIQNMFVVVRESVSLYSGIYAWILYLLYPMQVVMAYIFPNSHFPIELLDIFANTCIYITLHNVFINIFIWRLTLYGLLITLYCCILKCRQFFNYYSDSFRQYIKIAQTLINMYSGICYVALICHCYCVMALNNLIIHRIRHFFNVIKFRLSNVNVPIPILCKLCKWHIHQLIICIYILTDICAAYLCLFTYFISLLRALFACILTSSAVVISKLYIRKLQQIIKYFICIELTCIAGSVTIIGYPIAIYLSYINRYIEHRIIRFALFIMIISKDCFQSSIATIGKTYGNILLFTIRMYTLLFFHPLYVLIAHHLHPLLYAWHIILRCSALVVDCFLGILSPTIYYVKQSAIQFFAIRYIVIQIHLCRNQINDKSCDKTIGTVFYYWRFSQICDLHFFIRSKIAPGCRCHPNSLYNYRILHRKDGLLNSISKFHLTLIDTAIFNACDSIVVIAQCLKPLGGTKRKRDKKKRKPRKKKNTNPKSEMDAGSSTDSGYEQNGNGTIDHQSSLNNNDIQMIETIETIKVNISQRFDFVI